MHNIIYNFHVTHKTLPCLRTLLSVLKTEHAELGIDFSHESLRKVIKGMGFRWKKTVDNRQILLEKMAYILNVSHI